MGRELIIKMSKWSDGFIEQYKDVGTVKRLTREIKDAINKKKIKEEIDQTLTEVIKGKWKRKN